MKKFTLVLLVLFIAASFTFALDAEFTGATSATFGYNAEDGSTGFVNSSDVRIEIGILDQGSTSQEGDDLYGSIEVSDFEITLLSDELLAPHFSVVDGTDDFTTQPQVSAKIHKGPMYVGVYSEPSFDYNNAEEFGPALFDVMVDSTATSGGMTFGYDDDTYAVELRVASVGDYNDGFAALPTNVDNLYTYGLDASLAFGDAGLDFGVVYDNHSWANDPYMGFSLSPSYSMELNGGMGAEVTVGFDAYMNDSDSVSLLADEGMTYDGILDLAFYVAPENTDEDRSGLTASVYMGASTDPDVADVFNAVMDVQVAFEEFKTEGLMDGLGFSVTLGMFDLLDHMNISADMTYAVDVTGEYDVMAGVTPYFGFGMGTDDYETDLNVGVDLGSDFTGVDNTTFTLDYETPRLSDDTTNGVVAHAGIVTFMTEISF